MAKVVEIWVRYEIIGENGRVLAEGQVHDDPETFLAELEGELDSAVESIEEAED
jgi:hypothetical protein